MPSFLSVTRLSDCFFFIRLFIAKDCCFPSFCNSLFVFFVFSVFLVASTGGPPGASAEDAAEAECLFRD